MLYLDQPVQAGFSYSDIVNGTLNLIDFSVTPLSVVGNSTLPAVNATFGYGLFPDQGLLATTNTTVSSAKAVWQFAEHWLSSFPELTSSSGKISIWGNSYGGFWVPETGAQFSRQLASLPPRSASGDRNWTLDAIGTTNGCIDLETAMLGYPEYAYNNTYGVRFISEALYAASVDNITKAGGCLDQLRGCRAAGLAGDPDFTGANATINEQCEDSLIYCEGIIDVLNAYNNVSAFDVVVAVPDACPYYVPVAQYLNQAEP